MSVSDSGPAMEEPAGGAGGSGIPAPGYRLPSATRLGPVSLQVADLTRSLEYYASVLGLRAVDEAAGRVRLAAGDGTVLVELHERAGAAPPAETDEE